MGVRLRFLTSAEGGMVSQLVSKAARKGFLNLTGVVFLLVPALVAQSKTDDGGPQPLSAAEVVHNLQARNQTRAAALRQFEGTRTYSLHHRGFPKSLDAEMVVQLDYQAPSSKEFKIVSQSGSKFLVDRVFKRMIESEREAAKDQDHNALNESNYSFEMKGFERTPEGGQYVLAVTPRTKNKFLYRGTIWVDAADFAVARIEAAPAQNPSFFIKRTEVKHRYQKVGDFWLPAENHSVSYLRFGGHADLSIEYQNYKIIAADPIASVHTAARQPDPPNAENQFENQP
jgi:hypothetical protein